MNVQLTSVHPELLFECRFFSFPLVYPELEDLLGEQDEDIEGMQSIIYLLQKEVRQLKEENKRLKATSAVSVSHDAEMEEPSNAIRGPEEDEEMDGEADDGDHVSSEVDGEAEAEEADERREAADEGIGVGEAGERCLRDVPSPSKKKTDEKIYKE